VVRPKGLVLAGLILALTMIGCDDPPLSPMVSQSIEKVVALPTVSSSLKAQPSDFSVNPQVSVKIEALGPLRPNTPVVVRPTATANVDVSSVTLRAHAPEVEAARLSEFGPGYRIPIGVRLPLVGEWVIKNIWAGQSLTRTVQLTVPSEGYYRIIASAHSASDIVRAGRETYLPADQDERWLLISNQAGALTTRFEGDRVPAPYKPLRGPFRRRRVNPQGAALLSPVGKMARGLLSGMTGRFFRATNPELVVRISYYDENLQQWMPASGIHAEGTIEEFGQPVGTWQTTPSDVAGLAYDGCPGNQEELVGEVVQHHTQVRDVNTYGGVWIDYYGCQANDTVDVTIDRVSHQAFKKFVDVINTADGALGHARSTVSFIKIVGLSGERYVPALDRIEITTGNPAGRTWHFAHEYGHALHEKALGGIWATPFCGGHTVGSPSSYECALAEGFGNYVGQVAGQGQNAFGPFEGYHWGDAATLLEPQEEGNIAALFNDLIDSVNENGDNTTYPASYVLNVFKTCSPMNGVDQFVFCLEGSIPNSTLGLEFPPRLFANSSSGAPKPGNWSAADIRSTWLFNVGAGGTGGILDGDGCFDVNGVPVPC
jgi:hypothetical protein